MLAKGNTKLGDDGLIWSFSIPAIATCVGSTDVCRRLCYANSGFYWYNSVQAALWRNYRMSLEGDFAGLMVAEALRRRVRVLRIHVAGDFYSVGYAAKWHEIVHCLPDTRFYLYTRSWRAPDVRPALEEMALLPNLDMWWSADCQTGETTDRPGGVKIAYMMTDDLDVPDYAADLFFRDDHETVMKKVDGAQVCPVENGITKTTCSRCQVCFPGDGVRAEKTSRYALPTVAA